MFFDARSSNNHIKKLIAMLMSVALTQYIGGAQDDFYRLTAELEKTIERSKTDRQDFKNSNYTVLHFCGVKPAQEHKIINLCSNACLCTHPESNLSIIQIRKRISCDKQPKEQISDVILGLRSFVNHNMEREIFTADHQLSLHEIAVKNLHGFLTINDLVNRRVNCENLVHYIYCNSFKKALNESIDMLFKTILKKELQAYTMNLSNSKLHQKSFPTQDLAKDIKGIYKAIMIRLKAVETCKSWSLLFRKTYETYVVDCNSSLVAKLGLYKEHDENMISSINNHLMIYMKLYKMRALRFIERSIMPVIWQKFIKQADDEDNMAFVRSFYLIVNNIAERCKILPSGENTFETIFEESTRQIDQSIINYFGAIGLTKCLDSYKHANYSNKGYQINPIYMFNSIQIVCSEKITIENFSLLAHILSTVEKIFDDEKNHVIFIDMQKTINQDSFISGFYIPYLKKLSVTQPLRLTNKVLAEKLTIMTKSAGHSFATCSVFSLYNIKLRLYCSEEAKTLYNTRQSFLQNFSVAERVKIYPQLIKISCEYQQWDGQPLYGLNKEHCMESRNDIRLHLYNDIGDYDILIKPNFSSSGIVESLNVSHNLPHPILTNEDNYRFKFKSTNEGIKYNNVPSQDFLIALNLYLQTMMQIPEFTEIPALNHNGLNSSYHEQVQIPGLSKSISTYTDISTNTLDILNNRYCKTTISGKSILNPCLKLKYKDVLDRFLDENAWAQKIKDFTESYSIDIHKFGHVMDSLIIDQKHLNVTSDCGYFNYNCDNREIYIYAINNNSSMTDIYVIRDAIEMDYNNTLPYYYLFVYNICLKDDNISRQIQLLCDALTADLQIDPITVMFLALLQANYNIYSDLHKQYETLRNNFDIPFCQLLLAYSVSTGETTFTLETLQENISEYKNLEKIIHRILGFFRVYQMRPLFMQQTKVISFALNEVQDKNEELHRSRNHQV